MKTRHDLKPSITPANRRQSAKEQLDARAADTSSPLSSAETVGLVHELEVHQIELETQNQELIRTRKEVEKLLKKYVDLYDFAPVGYVTLDHNGIIGAVNLAGAAILGIERSVLLGRHFGLFVADEARLFLSGFLDKVFASPDRESCEIKLNKEGDYPYFVKIDALAFSTGQECRVTITDITEHKRIEKSLQQSEKCFRATFNQANVGIGHIAPDGSWLRINQKFCELVGYTEEEFKSLTLKSITHPDDLVTSMLHFQHLLDGTLESYSLEKRYISKDGSIVWVDLAVSIVFDDDGNPGFAVSIAEDITARKNAEMLIKKLNRDLAARAAELESANLELEAFNYSVAHDLRQPLNVISSYCQVIMELSDDTLDEQCRRYLHETYEGTLRMSRLIEALLNFSRVGRVEPQRDKVNLGEMAHEEVLFLKQTEPERRVDLLFNDGIVANGDAELLRVVLENLLGNAWKYTGTREKAVIEFGATEIDDKTVYFVRDNGVGFDNADAGKLFVPFRRLKGTDEYRGFGIGLATVERIIRRHGGKVWAEGEPGKGAVFFFSLPE